VNIDGSNGHDVKIVESYQKPCNLTSQNCLVFLKEIFKVQISHPKIMTRFLKFSNIT